MQQKHGIEICYFCPQNRQKVSFFSSLPQRLDGGCVLFIDWNPNRNQTKQIVFHSFSVGQIGCNQWHRILISHPELLHRGQWWLDEKYQWHVIYDGLSCRHPGGNKDKARDIFACWTWRARDRFCCCCLSDIRSVVIISKCRVCDQKMSALARTTFWPWKCNLWISFNPLKTRN